MDAIPESLIDTIEARLGAYNDDRTRYTLTPADVVQVAREAASSPVRFAIRRAGVSSTATRSTIALAVWPRDRDVIVVAIGSCPGNQASPGVAWPALKPWRDGSKRNPEKVQDWLADPDVSRVEIPLAVLRSSVPPSGEALLAQILATPDDDTPRLVYADWLGERGDRRGELIVVQCALELATDLAERARLEARAKELVGKHGTLWKRDAMQFASTAVLRRGFVSAITAKPGKFAAHGATLLTTEPLERLGVTDCRASDLDSLASSAHLARLRELHFTSPVSIGDADAVSAFRRFVRSPHVAAVREICLFLGLQDPLLDDLARAIAEIAWPVTTRVRIETYGVEANQIAVLLAGLARARLPALRTLECSAGSDAILAAAFPLATITRVQSTSITTGQ